MSAYDLTRLADGALLVSLKRLAGASNEITAHLLAHLAEVDARGIYRELACSSLYTYCVYELRMSEDEAQRRSRAAKAARQFPLLFDMLAEASIHLTGILLLAPHLTADNHVELLARARFRSKREIEKLVAQVAPRLDVRASVEPLGPAARAPGGHAAMVASLSSYVRSLPCGDGPGAAPIGPLARAEAAGVEVPDVEVPNVELPNVELKREATPEGEAALANDAAAAQRSVHADPERALRYKVQFTAGQAYIDLLEQARDLLQHQIPDRDLAEVQLRAMQVLVEELRKRKHAATAEPRSVAQSVLKGGRHVPAAVARSVWQRDQGRCSYADARGQRCRETAGLEFHHQHPYAQGGSTSAENLTLHCRAHNQLAAERDFGREYVVARRPREGARVEACVEGDSGAVERAHSGKEGAVFIRSGAGGSIDVRAALARL